MDNNQKPVDASIVYENQLISNNARQLQATLDDGLAGWVVREQIPALVPDTSKDKRWLYRLDDSVDHTGAKSAICTSHAPTTTGWLANPCSSKTRSLQPGTSGAAEGDRRSGWNCNIQRSLV